MGETNRSGTLEKLKQRGVVFPCGFDGVFIGEEVDLDRIETGVVLYPGTRLQGKNTLIREGTVIGATGPCVLEEMVIGKGASLGSGFFKKSVLLDRVDLGSAIRVRENCLLEEGCGLSFSVDVKQTFLLANVVLGSEINFCDLFMSGGTDRKDHSEVGSGVIHFNFTPFGKSGDKATPSLIGDVVHGVFYRSPRIFVGGHTSLVGPLNIGFGTVVAAGSRVTRDLGEGILGFGDHQIPEDRPDFDFLCYKNLTRKVNCNVNYIAQLVALWHWYARIRSIGASSPLARGVHQAALEVIAGGVRERVKRLSGLYDSMEESIARNRALGEDKLVVQQQAFHQRWPGTAEKLLEFQDLVGDEKARDLLIKAMREEAGEGEFDFPELVGKRLSTQAVDQGTLWLQSLVDALKDQTRDLAPKLV